MTSKEIVKSSLNDDPENKLVDKEIEIPKRISFWKKIPFIGLILILVKNILAGISDVLIKEMTDIDPVTLIFFRSTVMLSIEIPWSIIRDHPPFPAGLSLRERILQVIR